MTRVRKTRAADMITDVLGGMGEIIVALLSSGAGA